MKSCFLSSGRRMAGNLFRTLGCVFLAFGLLFAFLSPAAAQDWTGGIDSDWNTAGNWSFPAAVPGAGDGASIDNGTVGNAPVAGSGVTAVSNALFVGRTDASGSGQSSLTIENGGTVTTTGITYIGYGVNSRGRITVDSATSALTSGSIIYVGSSGEGELVLKNGGKATSGTGYSIYIGYDANGRGTINVSDSGSALSSGADINVGYMGGSMSYLNISGGGTATAVSDVIIGTMSQGTVNVSGSGSALRSEYLHQL